MWRTSSHSNGHNACIEVDDPVTWRKSSHSSANGQCVECGEWWLKSSFSFSNGNCAEVSRCVHVVRIRDSKLTGTSPILEFSSQAWEKFIDQIKGNLLVS
jgi:hypothetical protein